MMRRNFPTLAWDADQRWSTPMPRKIPKSVHMGIYIGIVSGLILRTAQRNQKTVPTLARYRKLCLRKVSDDLLLCPEMSFYIMNVLVFSIFRKTNVTVARIHIQYILV